MFSLEPVKDAFQFKVTKRAPKASDRLHESIKEPLLKTLSHFYLFLGSPGYGKSSQIESLIKDKNAYRRRFDQIHYICPNREDNLLTENGHEPQQPEDLQAIVDEITDDGQDHLFILSDCVAFFRKADVNTTLQALIFNRRHIAGPAGSVAIWMDAQTLVSVPFAVRRHIELAFVWKIVQEDIKNLYRSMLPTVSEFTFIQALRFIWKQGKHSFAVVSRYSPDIWAKGERLVINETD